VDLYSDFIVTHPKGAQVSITQLLAHDIIPASTL